MLVTSPSHAPVPDEPDPVTVGVDFGTLSGRAVVVRVSDGEELGSAVCEYPHAVLDRALPVELAGRDVRLGPDWALQVPADYVEVLRDRGARRAARTRASTRRRSSASPPTSPPARWCRPPPTAPRCASSPGHAAEPHAYVKLWKHHAAQPQADRINELARKRGEAWLPRYGGLISSEWEFAKGLQLLEEAPEVYAAMAHFVEAADWIVWQLCGTYVRNACTAGYKGIYQDGTYPTPGLPRRAQPRLRRASSTTSSTRPIGQLGAAAGRLTERGRRAGPGCPRGSPSRSATSTPTSPHPPRDAIERRPDGRDHGHLDVPRDERRHPARGPGHVRGRRRRHHRRACGATRPASRGVGDIFNWFVTTQVPAAYAAEAAERGISVHELLTEKAAEQADRRARPGRPRLAQRQPLGAGRPRAVRAGGRPDPGDPARGRLPRAARGHRVRHPRSSSRPSRRPGVPVTELVVAGGLLKNALLMQIYADVLDLPLSTIGSQQGPALGSAIHAAVAAGAYPDVPRAAARDGPASTAACYQPDRRPTSRPTTSCTPSTAPCTTTSAAAATTSCSGSRRSAAGPRA